MVHIAVHRRVGRRAVHEPDAEYRRGEEIFPAVRPTLEAVVVALVETEHFGDESEEIVRPHDRPHARDAHERRRSDGGKYNAVLFAVGAETADNHARE